jgi:hypothetical protein
LKSPATIHGPWQTALISCNNNNNNQDFYFQASWGRLEMKSHDKKTGTKQERKIRGKQMAIKKPNKKRRKDNKTLSQKSEKGARKKT